MIAFGPVPSRRLGRSVGINNIPPKVCTYSCVYCQVGRTMDMQIERRRFYEPTRILRDVQDKLADSKAVDETVDYITFVPDGEPSLDVNLGREIDLLRSTGMSIAVISNASLLWRQDVREDLMKADWVSLKIDAAGEETWRKVNRPHGSLSLAAIQDGMLQFARDYNGTLATETLLVEGVNDSKEQAQGVAGFLAALEPAVAYVSIPTRPPAETWARAPSEEAVNRFYQVVSSRVKHLEYLIGYEGNAFASTGDPGSDLLSTTAVHPMREEAVKQVLSRTGASWEVVESLLQQGKLKATDYEGNRYFIRSLRVADTTR